LLVSQISQEREEGLLEKVHARHDQLVVAAKEEEEDEEEKGERQILQEVGFDEGELRNVHLEQAHGEAIKVREKWRDGGFRFLNRMKRVGSRKKEGRIAPVPIKTSLIKISINLISSFK
jgi:hypothetical protein